MYKIIQDIKLEKILRYNLQKYITRTKLVKIMTKYKKKLEKMSHKKQTYKNTNTRKKLEKIICII